MRRLGEADDGCRPPRAAGGACKAAPAAILSAGERRERSRQSPAGGERQAGRTHREPDFMSGTDPDLRRVFVKTYGCQMTVYDSERMTDVLAPFGYVPVDTAEFADLIL